MKKIFFTLLPSLLFVGCMSKNYPTTTFYVKNTSDKTQNFRASIIKQNMHGPFEMTLPFSVQPNDSIVARRVGFHRDARPTAWFKSFVIFPADGTTFNDPNLDENWVKSTDERGNTVYTFTMTK